MNITLFLGSLAGLMALASLAGLFYYVMHGKKEQELQNLLEATRGARLGTVSEERERLKNDTTGAEYERLKKLQKQKIIKSKNKVSKEDLYFHAGIFSDLEKQKMQTIEKVAPIIGAIVMGIGIWYMMGDPMLSVVALMIGMFAGMQYPKSIIDRRILARGEDIMFFLPLVIEQIAIGVSSSLDIGPCLQRVVQMADERDCHNVVTELIKIVELQIKTGISLDEALTEVATKSGHNELKHSFVALAQVARHGGEITKQLHELAEAVGSQREAQIEGKIKKLELAATGPVALVFMGFMIIILIGFGIQLKGIMS
jgi:tight adherence protein C